MLDARVLVTVSQVNIHHSYISFFLCPHLVINVVSRKYIHHMLATRMVQETTPSVHYAKDWLDHLFLFPGLEKGFTYGCGH